MAKKSPAKILKGKGLIPKHWDLRRPLSIGQKSWITKQSNKYAQLIRRPEDFAIKRVGKSSREILKKSGYAIEGNKAIIPAKGAKVRVKGGALEFVRPHQTERVILKGGPDFLRQVEKLYSKKLKRNQAWALKIGDSPTINTLRPDLRELIAYARTLNFHSPSGSNHVSLVLVTVNGPGLIGHASEDDEDSDEWDEDEEDEE